MSLSLLRYYCYKHLKNTVVKTVIFFKPIAVSIIAAIIISSIFISAATGQSLPAGFSQVLVANGISSPTVMAFAPDGRIFIAQQTGQLRIIKNGVLLAQPFISLSVNSSGERGLLGIAFDPAFASNNFIYLYYTLPSAVNNRISRFTANGDIAVAGSEVVILNLDPLSTATNHNGGTMQFGPDGKLYVGVGENANAVNSQNLDTYLGKVLRINKDGSVPAGNPFTTGSNQRQRVWEYGVRNPFTISFQPGTGRLFINDVGQVTWEEIDEGTRGGLNFGWPNAEGNSTNPAYTNPVYTYEHGTGSGLGCAITGGTFFNPAATNYPSSYIGRYFYIDYCGNWIDMLRLSTSSWMRYPFASSIAGSPVSIATGPDGNLYFLSRANSAVYKITYTSSQMPVITNQPQTISVAEGSPASFSVSATGTAPLSYQWRKNAINISGAIASSYTIPAVTPSSAGIYSVIVTNMVGSSTSNNATLTVTQPNQVPVATINTPAAGATFAAGTSINFSGNGMDPEDGILGATAFTWFVVFHHDTHTHPGPSAPSGVKSGSFSIPNTGETSSNVFYRLYLVVTDSQGAKDTAYTDITPRTSAITINTNPQGLQITLDGQPFKSPLTVSSVEGMLRAIGTVSPQTLNGTTYTFSNWSHGGAQTQTIATPVNDSGFTANFSTTVTTTLTPVADAYVRSRAYGNTNYGSDPSLILQNSGVPENIYQSYLRFDISTVPLNSSSVKLRLYGNLDNTNNPVITTQLFNVPGLTWQESDITNSNRPYAQTTVLATADISGTIAKYYEWDLTAYINTRRSFNSLAFSIEIRNLTVTGNNRVIFNSKENTTNKPELVITNNSSRLANAYPAFDPIVADNNLPESFYVYPNPANGYLTVKYLPELSGGTLQIIDLAGRIVLTKNLTEKNVQPLITGYLKEGIYILVIEKENKKYSQRVMIKK